MAQVGSALGSGLRGRRFKSACPDQLLSQVARSSAKSDLGPTPRLLKRNSPFLA